MKNDHLFVRLSLLACPEIAYPLKSRGSGRFRFTVGNVSKPFVAGYNYIRTTRQLENQEEELREAQVKITGEQTLLA